MPAGIGYPGPMGGANPQNLEAMAAAGDPRAIAMLQQLQAQGGGAPGMGGPPPGGMPPGGGGMPPMGAAPPMGGMPPMGAAPPMSQSEFGNGGQQVPPDVAARRAQMLIQMLRNRR